MSSQRANELLYDSAAALRLVDHELEEMGHDVSPVIPRLAQVAEDPTLGDVHHVLLRAQTAIARVLHGLKRSRETLQRTSMAKISLTHDKLREVCSTTETAATDILNSLDRAGLLLDDLDAQAAAGHAGDEGADTRAQLRDELFTVMGHMQFQDITTQQLTHASNVLAELEAQLTEVAQIFDLEVAQPTETAAQAVRPLGNAYAPSASMADPEERQALADAIINGKR